MVATVIVIAAVGWMFLISNSYVFTASSRLEEVNNNTNFPKEMENAPKDRYLKSNITINGFKLTTDLALTNEQMEKGLSVKDKLKENEAMLLFLRNLQNIHFG
jgi:hypothetical protein